MPHREKLPGTSYSRQKERIGTEELNRRARVRRYERRQKILEHYGGKCACCGEARYEFLAIDHIDGGGRQHAKSLGGNENLYAWIVKNNFPDMFRILCHNCNMARGMYGYCPHETERERKEKKKSLLRLLNAYPNPFLKW